MGKQVIRGPRRTANPDIFVSHSSRDKGAAIQLAKTLNFCAVDVWLDDWELEIGESLTDRISQAMNQSKYIAILITENYNKTVWTKTEYKRALAREQKEQRTVMLPLIVGKAEIPEFLEDKIYIDLRERYLSGILQLVGMIHRLDKYRVSSALSAREPQSVLDVWELLEEIGFDPYVVLGEQDFQEVLRYGGRLAGPNYLQFDPQALLESKAVSEHIKSFAKEFRRKAERGNLEMKLGHG